MTDTGETKITKPSTDGRPDLVGGYDTIKNKVLNANANGRLQQAAKAYKDANQNLYDSAQALRDQAEVLAEHWTGDAAAKAQHALRQLNGTAWELGAKAVFAGGAHQSAADYLDWYQQNFPGTGMVKNGMKIVTLGMGGGEDDEHAQDFLSRLNTRYNQVITNEFPDFVSWSLPQLDPREKKWQPRDLGTGGTGTSGGGLPGGGMPGGGMPGGDPGFNPSDPGMPPVGSGDPPGFGGPSGDPPGFGDPGFGDPGIGDPGIGGPGTGTDPFGDDTSLAGVDPAGGFGVPGGGFGGPGGGFGSPGGGFGGPGGGLGADGAFGAGGLGSGSSGLGAGGGLGQGGMMPGGMPGGGAGGRGAAGRGGMGRPMGMMPHGAGGEGEQERERTSWLTEDEDIWGGNADTAPPVIGGAG